MELSDGEKRIIKLLEQLGGRTTQVIIIETTGFSGQQVSRLLRRMEKKGLVVRRSDSAGWGRAKEVFLKEKFEELPDAEKVGEMSQKSEVVGVDEVFSSLQKELGELDVRVDWYIRNVNMIADAVVEINERLKKVEKLLVKVVELQGKSI